MSFEPPATGRVKSIKSKFERLNSLEPLDISAPALNKTPNKVPKFHFKRSCTSIDLTRKLEKITPFAITIVPEKCKLLQKRTNDTSQCHNNNIIIQSSPVKNRNVVKNNNINSNNNKDVLKPLNEIKENVEVRLSRHTSDPIKRGSIKRSPAFRVGDKSNKTVVQKAAPIVPKEFATKFDELLKRSVTDAQKLQEAGLTDTLKAVLKQPLPTGPPPKKPPRTFADKPVAPVACSPPTKEIKNKINFLENNLVFKAAESKQSPSRNKEKNVLSNSLLNCIPCSSPIYDSTHYQRFKQNKPAESNNKNNSRQKQIVAPTISNDMNYTSSYKPSTYNKKHTTAHEHIYMEPFIHIKTNNNNHNFTSCVPEILTNNLSDESHHSLFLIKNHASDNESLHNASLISCSSCAADDHSPQSEIGGDIHYMCTTIDDNKLKTSEPESIGSESENPLMLSNTYDEINILVSAAFGQHNKTDSMGNAVDHDASSESGSASKQNQQQKTAIKLYRTLTEKRKDYVRRVSAVKPTTPTKNNNTNVPSYATLHRTFKPKVFKTFSFENDSQEFDSKNGGETNADFSSAAESSSTTTENKNHDELSETRPATDNNDESRTKLFQVCLLIGYNTSTSQAYIKFRFPSDEEVPLNIEQLVFPSKNMIRQDRKNQDYSLILTDHNGYHVYGYCRRVLPESCDICLPLAYCLITEAKAPGFYFKVLREIESRHGQSDAQLTYLLTSLQNQAVPEAGKFLHLKLPLSPRPKTIFTSNHKIAPKRLSLEVNPKWLTESAAQAAFSNEPLSLESTSSNESHGKKERSGNKSLIQEYEEKKQEKNNASAPFDLSLINRSLFNGQRSSGQTRVDEVFIRRPNDLRLESTELHDLYQTLGPDVMITIFSSLLLERKVILYTENISLLSSCVFALQTVLYPFQWQHALVTVLPQSLIEICQAPIPVLAGILEPLNFDIEDGIVVCLDNRTIIQQCGDETTILPTSLRDALRVSLEMVDLIDQGKMLSSVLIAEAFLRFFVELFVGYKYKYFDKKLFIESNPSQTIRLFLEWLVETAMFRQFILEKYALNYNPNSSINFYDLFDARVLEKSENRTTESTQQNMETIMKNCKIINKKAKTFKDRFKDFLSNNN